MSLRLRGHLTAGILLVVPVFATVAVLSFLFSLLDSWARPLTKSLTGLDIPGLGLLLTLALVYVTGFLSTNFAGKKLLELFDRLLENLPLVKTVYTASKQLVEAVSPGGRRAFGRVVLVEFPKKGTFALGFVTGEGVGPLKNQMVSVYVPTAINPTSGFVVFASPEELLDPGLTVEEGVKLVVSGGVVRPASPADASALVVNGGGNAVESR
jgi:uncharacterized membrane protein